MKIERFEYEDFANEIWLTKGGFVIILKENDDDIEIDFDNGTGRTYIPLQLIKDLIAELEQKVKEKHAKK